MAIDPGLQQFCLLMGLAFGGVLMLALVTKLAEVYRARNWLITSGTITKSQVRSRKRRESDEGHHYHSEPLVTYEYAVGGKHYRGTRINFAERIGGTDIMPTLARYPVGNQVPVYYNPADPKQAVLERDLPPVVFIGVGILILIFIGGAIVAPLALAGTIKMVAPTLPNPERAPIVTMLGAMGLFAILMWFALQKEVWAAKHLNIAEGRILVADVESYQKEDTSSRTTTLYRPSIVYTFEVNGRQYISDRVNFGSSVSGTMLGKAPWFVSDQAAKYPPDNKVSVYYNPDNPSESVLERRTSGGILLLGIASVLVALAVVIGYAR